LNRFAIELNVGDKVVKDGGRLCGQVPGVEDRLVVVL
jgi:hypothetical protein